MTASTEVKAPAVGDIIYMAWTIIANASEGDWNKEHPTWKEAAVRWRDEMFHPYLRESGYAPGREEG